MSDLDRLQDSSDSPDNAVNISRIQGCKADAACTDGVDGMFLAQAIYLLEREP